MYVMVWRIRAPNYEFDFGEGSRREEGMKT